MLTAKTKALTSVFAQFSESDAQNISSAVGLMAQLTGQFADFTGVQAAQIEAIEEMLEEKQYIDEETELPGCFQVRDKSGELVTVRNVRVNEQGSVYDFGPFTEMGDLVATLLRRGYNMYKMEGVTLVSDGIVARKRTLAKKIWTMLNDGKVCVLCEQFNLMKGEFCCKCALDRLPAPCVGCGITMGRSAKHKDADTTDPENEHPACKRRRVEQ